MNLVRAELTKVLTTSLWWIFGLIMVPLWGASVGINWLTASVTAGTPDPLLGAILVTSEYFHLTATTTFLVTPRRERVIVAKLVVGVLIGLAFWAVTTVGNLIVVPFVLRHLKVGAQLGEPAVWRAIGLNALAYAVWAILGVGMGVLIRSQLAATLTLAGTYLIGTSGLGLVFTLLADRIADWINNLRVLIPTVASQLMISGTDLPGNPPRWVGAAVLLGYALISGLLGTAITRRRDIS